MIHFLCSFFERLSIFNSIVITAITIAVWGAIFTFGKRKTTIYDSNCLLVYRIFYGCVLSLCLVQYLHENSDIFDMFPGSVPLSLVPLSFVIRITLLAVILLGLLHVIFLHRVSSFSFNLAKGWHLLHSVVVIGASFSVSYYIHLKYGKNFLDELQKTIFMDYAIFDTIFAFTGLFFSLMFFSSSRIRRTR